MTADSIRRAGGLLALPFLAAVPLTGRRCRGADEDGRAPAKAVEAIASEMSIPSRDADAREWVRFLGRDPYAAATPGRFEDETGRLKGGLRKLARAPLPDRRAIPPAFREDVRFHWQRGRLWALEMLAAFRDPADLPLLWADIEMYSPGMPGPSSLDDRRHEKYPVAEAMCAYGGAAKAFLIERIARGDTDRWTLETGQREIGGLLLVLGKVAGDYEVCLHEEAAKRPREERERLLACLRKLRWGIPLEELLPRIEGRIREGDAARMTPRAGDSRSEEAAPEPNDGAAP